MRKSFAVCMSFIMCVLLIAGCGKASSSADADTQETGQEAELALV